METQVLNQDVIKQHLSTIGRNPVTFRYAYTTIILENMRIQEINELEKYTYLQHVHLQHNCIESIQALRQLPNLLSVDLSHNHLVRVLDYHTPCCTKEDAWMEGSFWIGSMLVQANLAWNRISSINDISQHKYLRELYLDHNKIQEITGVSSLKCLQTLSMSHNELKTTRGLRSLRIQRLDLNHNQITELTELHTLPRLYYLDLCNNKLTKLYGLQKCTSIHELFLENNDINSTTQLSNILSLPLLGTLTCKGCPISRDKYYRNDVLARLPNLVSFDGHVVSAKERVKAGNMFGKFGKTLHEKFTEYLPGETYNNTIAYQELKHTSHRRDLNVHAENEISQFAIKMVKSALILGNIKYLSKTIADEAFYNLRVQRLF